MATHRQRFQVPLLRNRADPSEGRVGFVELFFDLVFVFAVTQLSHHLVGHLSLWGALEAGVLLLGVWTVWVYTTWATNWLNPRHVLIRLLFFAMMALGLLLSTSIPRAFADRGLTFALSLAGMHIVRSLVTVWCLRGDAPARRNFERILFWLVISGVLWVGGAFLDVHGRVLLWIAALVVELGSPWWLFWTPGMGVSTISDWQVSASHFAERCGLFIIIALGESVIITGLTFTGLEWTRWAVLAFASALVTAIAIWWVYFATTAEAAAEEFEHRASTGELARAAYTYAHVPIVAGIILTAVGDEFLLAHPRGHVSDAMAWVLLGGPVLFLLGSALFNRMMCGVYPRSHGVAVVLLLAVALARASLEPWSVAAAAAVVLIVVGAWETVRGRPVEWHDGIG